MAVRCPYREDFVTVYAETREQSGVTVYCRSRIASWDGWPADVVDVLHGWNKDRRLRFVGMDTISRVPPQASFKCPDCERFINPSGSTAAKLDDALVCDDCVILRVRKWGALGRPETELEKCKRWQRNVQKKLVKYRYNAISEAAYVSELKAAATEASALFTLFTVETDTEIIPSYDQLHGAALRLSDAIRGAS